VQGQVKAFCEHCNELSDFIKGEKSFEKLRYYQLSEDESCSIEFR
jgi:hypothetical protein